MKRAKKKKPTNVSLAAKHKALCDITRALHFAWREAAVSSAPGVKPADIVNSFWEITAKQTAESYIKRIDPAKPLAPQIARCIVWSSLVMGEDARVVKGKNNREAFVSHKACPWFEWHKYFNLLDEDQSGCDTWFFKTVEYINKRLGASVRIETQKSLPGGAKSCVRRIWEERKS